jgi:hypothetical protein
LVAELLKSKVTLESAPLAGVEKVRDDSLSSTFESERRVNVSIPSAPCVALMLPEMTGPAATDGSAEPNP